MPNIEIRTIFGPQGQDAGEVWRYTIGQNETAYSAEIVYGADNTQAYLSLCKGEKTMAAKIVHLTIARGMAANWIISVAKLFGPAGSIGPNSEIPVADKALS